MKTIKTGSLACVIKYEGHERTINGHRMVYVQGAHCTRHEAAQYGLNELLQTFGQEELKYFSIHGTRVKAEDQIMPIQYKDNSWMWA